MYRVEQDAGITRLEIRTAATADQQRITGKNGALNRIADTCIGMARRLQNSDFPCTQLDGIALRQQNIGAVRLTVPVYSGFGA